MKLFGFEISRRTKTHTSTFGLSAVPSHGGWFPLVVHEPFTGAWQRNQELRQDTLLSFATVYRCVTLIATDVAKLKCRLVEQDEFGIWNEVARNSPFWPVLRKPNHHQTRIKFIERWMLSKLIHGNAYVLKQRNDQRGVVTAMYVLDPTRVRVLVAPNGDVFYSVGQDNLAQVEDAQAVIPASEIIHDMMPSLYHDLHGISPITACGLSALQGLKVQEHSSSFFGNGARPGGILTAPGVISEETAKNLQNSWEQNFGGQNAGRVAVLGDGLKYEQMTMSATDAQLVEQLKLSAEMVCQAFGVPAYKVGVGPMPSYNNIEALNQQYYSDCLQIHIESIEELLDLGLGVRDAESQKELGTEFDLDDLMRMDTATRVRTSSEAIKGGGMAPNEARKRFLDLRPVPGGDSPMLQQQNYSLEALAKRDAKADPFAKGSTGTPALPVGERSAELTEERVEVWLRKALAA